MGAAEKRESSSDSSAESRYSLSLSEFGLGFSSRCGFKMRVQGCDFKMRWVSCRSSNSSWSTKNAPTLPHPDGFGAASTLIVSLRWPAATVHANLEVNYSRDHKLEALGGAIVEGPHTWRIRPVAEGYVEREGDGVTLFSALGGAIWGLREDLSVDAAARAAREAGSALFELRLGMTWAFAL